MREGVRERERERHTGRVKILNRHTHIVRHGKGDLDRKTKREKRKKEPPTLKNPLCTSQTEPFDEHKVSVGVFIVTPNTFHSNFTQSGESVPCKTRPIARN